MSELNSAEQVPGEGMVYINTSVPIPAEAVKAYFKDKERTSFRINYSTSRLKGDVFLTYVTNYNVPSDVVFSNPPNLEEYLTFMQAYLKQRMVCSLLTPSFMMAQILLIARGLSYDDVPYMKGVIPLEFVQKFIEDNKQLVDNWLHFLDSSVVYAVYAIKVLNDRFKPEEIYPKIDDKEFIGHNLVNMYGVPDFMALYFSLQGDAVYRESFFEQQYNSYMFGNKRLAAYFDHPNNFIQAVYTGVAQGKIDLSNPEAFIKG